MLRPRGSIVIGVHGIVTSDDIAGEDARATNPVERLVEGDIDEALGVLGGSAEAGGGEDGADEDLGEMHFC